MQDDVLLGDLQFEHLKRAPMLRSHPNTPYAPIEPPHHSFHVERAGSRRTVVACGHEEHEKSELLQHKKHAFPRIFVCDIVKFKSTACISRWRHERL